MSLTVLLFDSNNGYSWSWVWWQSKKERVGFSLPVSVSHWKDRKFISRWVQQQNPGSLKENLYRIWNPVDPVILYKCLLEPFRTLFQKNILFSDLKVAEATRKEGYHCAINVEVNIIWVRNSFANKLSGIRFSLL